MSPRAFALSCAAFTAAAALLYLPALRGPFFSDDLQYVVNNPYVQTLEPGALLALFDPAGEPAVFTWNYAPIHLLAHALQWRAFGADPLGYHLSNVVLHAIVSALLVPLFAGWGLSRRAALALATLFLLHPANVEAVAWIFQLKTIGALGLALGALLAFRTRPLLALVLFALAMLTKVTAAPALPVAGLWLWLEPPPPGAARSRAWAGLAAWTVALALCLAAEFPHFHHAQHGEAVRYASAGVHLRSVVAIAGRYLAMAATGHGLSTFHETPPAVSLLDPWWLLGLAALALLTARWVVALRRRSLEAVAWAWAAGSFALVSQVFPFLYPMADHYLYPILPGLLAAAGFVARDAWRWGAARLAASGRQPPAPAQRRAVALALVALAALAFGARSVERAALWASDLALVRDSARNYPEGRAGVYLQARRAAAHGDVARAAAGLQRLAALGHDGFLALYQDPIWAPLFGRPDFDAALGRLAGNWLQRTEGRPRLLQADLRARGLAHLARGELDAAIADYERALARGGPLDEQVRAELAALRERAAQRE